MDWLREGLLYKLHHLYKSRYRLKLRLATHIFGAQFFEGEPYEGKTIG